MKMGTRLVEGAKAYQIRAIASKCPFRPLLLEDSGTQASHPQQGSIYCSRYNVTGCGRVFQGKISVHDGGWECRLAREP